MTLEFACSNTSDDTQSKNGCALLFCMVAVKLNLMLRIDETQTYNVINQNNYDRPKTYTLLQQDQYEAYTHHLSYDHQEL